MTVTAAEARIEYAGNGTTTIFAFPYQFFQADDLDVWLFKSGTEVGAKQILGANYIAVGMMNPSGGYIQFITPAPTVEMTVIIINNPDIIQPTHYVNADDFPADSHEQGLDRLTKICQRLSDRVDRAVRAPDYAPEDSVPDADTLVGLVDQAEEAAAESSASANAAQVYSQQSASYAEQALNYSNQANYYAGLAETSNNNSFQSATHSDASAEESQGYADAAASSAAAAAASAAAAKVEEVDWIGNWSASVTYEANDAVFFTGTGSSYISKTTNNNKPPDTNPTDWDMLAQRGAPGAAGAGAGDMLGANNLADVTNIATSRTNLGLGNSATLNVGTGANTVAAGDAVVLKTGSTMTGNLTITKSFPLVILNKTAASGQSAIIQGQTNGLARWDVSLGNPTAEGGNQIGNDFAINRYHDAGTYLDTPFVMARFDSSVKLLGNVTIINTFPIINLDKTASGQAAAIYGKTGTLNRWSVFLGDGAAESGSDAGSNFSIARYGNAGVFIDIPLSINRSTGLVNFNTTAQFAGGTEFNGDITVKKANPYILLNKAASGQSAILWGTNNGLARWEVNVGNATAEGGGNTGSDFAINAYGDTGAFFNSPVAIKRSNGEVTMAGSVNVGNVYSGNLVTAGNQPSVFYMGAAGGTNYLSFASGHYFSYSGITNDLSYSLFSAARFHVRASSGYFEVVSNASKPGGGAWLDSSDIRIKNVSGEYERGLDDVCKLHPVRYTFKGNDTYGKPTGPIKTPKFDEQGKAVPQPEPKAPDVAPYPNSPHYQSAVEQRKFAGLIAQEVETIFPEMVTKRDGHIDGQPVSDLCDLDTTPLIFALINCVKELRARVEVLEGGGA